MNKDWNKFFPKSVDETEGTEIVRLDEIVQLCNIAGLNSKLFATEVLTDFLSCDKTDGGFGICNDSEVASSVTTIEEETNDDN